MMIFFFFVTNGAEAALSIKSSSGGMVVLGAKLRPSKLWTGICEDCGICWSCSPPMQNPPALAPLGAPPALLPGLKPRSDDRDAASYEPRPVDGCGRCDNFVGCCAGGQNPFVYIPITAGSFICGYKKKIPFFFLLVLLFVVR